MCNTPLSTPPGPCSFLSIIYHPRLARRERRRRPSRPPRAPRRRRGRRRGRGVVLGCSLPRIALRFHLRLFEYNWGQVSVIKWKAAPGKSGPKTFNLAVKTLPTIMQELGHERVHVLKVDVEGSEWLFLEDMFDRMGCPPVDQLTVEFHHFDFDSRYGMIPQVMAVTNLLRACGW